MVSGDPASRLRAQVVHRDPNMDIAVLSVPRSSIPDVDDLLARAKMGRMAFLRTGDEVIPVGCPRGECWSAPY